MPTKKGAGGRQQNYDSHGRYVKSVYPQNTLSKKEKSRIKRERQIETFCLIADKKNDPLVKLLIIELEKAIPYSIQFVNGNKFDFVHNKIREFDIITRKVVIEVKSGSARRNLTQFKEQKDYADSKNKKYVVFAPNIGNGTKKEYNKNGIEIKTSIKELVSFVREYEK